MLFGFMVIVLLVPLIFTLVWPFYLTRESDSLHPLCNLAQEYNYEIQITITKIVFDNKFLI
jgi:hypothetical protein